MLKHFSPAQPAHDPELYCHDCHDKRSLSLDQAEMMCRFNADKLYYYECPWKDEVYHLTSKKPKK